MMETVEISILGPLEIKRGGHALPLPRGKARAALAALLLRPNEVVPTAELIDELWGEDLPQTADNTLQVHVSQLRKALGADKGRLVTRPPGYMFVTDGGELDSERFDGLCRRAREAMARGAFGDASDMLDDALRLWRGAPLADVAMSGIARGEIARLEECRLAALEDRFDADLALGRQHTIVGEVHAALADHPLRECLYRQLMIALYRDGRHADALAVYRTARSRLRDELGIEPSRALTNLQKAILVQDASLDGPSSGLAAAGSLRVRPAAATGKGDEVDAEGDFEALARARLEEARSAVRAALSLYEGSGNEAAAKRTRRALRTLVRGLGDDALTPAVQVAAA